MGSEPNWYQIGRFQKYSNIVLTKSWMLDIVTGTNFVTKLYKYHSQERSNPLLSVISPKKEKQWDFSHIKLLHLL